MLIVSKYGFFDVLDLGRVTLDPSRVAAQIVSGVGFLGAGLLLIRWTVVDRGVDVVSVRMELVGRASAHHVIASLRAVEGVRDVAMVTEDELD